MRSERMGYCLIMRGMYPVWVLDTSKDERDLSSHSRAGLGYWISSANVRIRKDVDTIRTARSRLEKDVWNINEGTELLYAERTSVERFTHDSDPPSLLSWFFGTVLPSFLRAVEPEGARFFVTGLSKTHSCLPALQRRQAAG